MERELFKTVANSKLKSLNFTSPKLLSFPRLVIFSCILRISTWRGVNFRRFSDNFLYFLVIIVYSNASYAALSAPRTPFDTFQTSRNATRWVGMIHNIRDPDRKMSTLSSANFTDGNILLKERTDKMKIAYSTSARA